ncbi:[acyl-carrier-protein] S-malonyltransferase [Dongia mobilis]|uniref:Malonyl CoA-acyl carrier protein transacylase n=1 Tax=Dongia mobilis TaxID=578943 RepID=A0A4R6WTP5_9PROT|nr:ACP S-malonyltransferase [Dongia mobilis]TDQ82484.1 [acyl-carrier-protein] S-malonyltransferase [Dongia mobilis]
MRAFVFPGQGSQAVGMGKALAEAFAPARLVFEEVDDALGQKLSHLMFEGPEGDLTLTENAQPALMAVSMAVLRVLEAEGGFKIADKASYVAGHSLGEYSALAAAGAFTLADTARLLKLRGQAMQKAVPVGEGAMAALLNFDLARAEKVAAAAAAETKLVCAVANDNDPSQVVVSGAKAAVERAGALALEAGAKRAVMLPVSAPFHCPLMQPAADAMAEALAKTQIHMPVVPVIANVTAQPVSDPATIRDLLVKQVTGTVRWRESVETMKKLNVDRVFELGAGKVLSGLVKRIDKEIEAQSVGQPADIEAALKILV